MPEPGERLLKPRDLLDGGRHLATSGSLGVMKRRQAAAVWRRIESVIFSCRVDGLKVVRCRCLIVLNLGRGAAEPKNCRSGARGQYGNTLVLIRQ